MEKFHALDLFETVSRQLAVGENVVHKNGFV